MTANFTYAEWKIIELSLEHRGDFVEMKYGEKAAGVYWNLLEKVFETRVAAKEEEENTK